MTDSNTQNTSERIVVYRTSSCPFCVAAEGLLKEKGVQFQEVFLDDHRDRRSFTAEILPGHHTVPLVVVDETPIGGYQELQAFDRDGKLDAFV